MKRKLSVLTTAVAVAMVIATSAAHANSTKASEGSLVGSAVIVVGTYSVVAASGQLIVESVEKVGELVTVVAKSAANGSKVTLQFSGKALETTAVVAGTALRVVTEAAGASLVASGKIVAFVPNEVGQSLLHHSRHTEPAQPVKK